VPGSSAQVARFFEPPASLQLLKNLLVRQSRWSNKATAEHLPDGLTNISRYQRRPLMHEHRMGGLDKHANCLIKSKTTEDFDEHTAHCPDVNLLNDLRIAIEQLVS